MGAENSRAGGGRTRILVVDDEPDIILVIKAGLERAGYEVDAFTDPAKALKNFKPNYYHRIITDIRMPSISGFELARRINAIDGGAHVCFLSAFEIHEDEARKVMPHLKSYCFVTKPVTATVLAKHIAAHSAEY